MTTQQPPETPPRVAAREAIYRFLGQPSGQARMVVATCTDEEVAALVAAAGDKLTAREKIKRILAQAYDRRSVEAALRAANLQQRLRRSRLARTIFEKSLGLTVQQALDACAALETLAGGSDALDALLQFDDDDDRADAAVVILRDALPHLAADSPHHPKLAAIVAQLHETAPE